MGPPPDFSKEEWFKLKPTLPLDFPNLPYLYDGNVKISQSITIMRYLGRKYDLYPTNEEATIRVDLIEQQLLDWRRQSSMVFYNPNYEQLKDQYIDGLPKEISSLAKFLGSNDFLAGSKLTYVDFLAYEWLDVHRIFLPSVLDSFDVLKKYIERIESIPRVKEFMDSSKFIKWPINNDQARWGSRHTPI